MWRGRSGGRVRAKGGSEGARERGEFKAGRGLLSKHFPVFPRPTPSSFLPPPWPTPPPPCPSLPPLRRALPPTPAILMSGVVWIVTSPTVDLVIRSTVAVMFVLNVDEIVYQSCCPAFIMHDVEVCACVCYVEVAAHHLVRPSCVYI
jgi:hypothetical protein